MGGFFGGDVMPPFLPSGPFVFGWVVLWCTAVGAVRERREMGLGVCEFVFIYLSICLCLFSYFWERECEAGLRLK